MMGSPDASFYKTLALDKKEVRLLSVLPGKPSEEISCTLRYAEFNDILALPEYETISYCWGDIEQRESITVDGHEALISSSVAGVIRTVRLPTEARLIWIDAVCINQEDIDERNNQVLLMRNIYANCTQNLICMEGDLSESFSEVRAILANSSGVKGMFRRQNGRVEFGYAADCTISISIDESKLIKLFSHKWFWRVWTFQEAVLPKHSTCISGASQMPLVDIVRSAVTLMYNGMFVTSALIEALESACGMIETLDPDFFGVSIKRDEDDDSVAEAIDNLHLRGCKESVDRIYGILGVSAIPGITPDYRKPPLQVFRDTTRLIMTNERKLRPLVYAGITNWSAGADVNHLSGELPSWVPQWHKQQSMQDRVGSTMSTSIYDASNRRRYKPKQGSLDGDAQDDTLTVYGLLVGRITHMTNTLFGMGQDAPKDPGKHMTSFLSQVQDFAAMATVERPKSPEQEDLRIASVLTMHYSIAPTEGTARFLACYRAFKRYLEAGELQKLSSYKINSPEWKTIGEEQRGAIKFVTDLGSGCLARKVFLTDTGHLGNGPRSIQEGDVAAVLYGLDKIAILRPTANNQYLFVGESYVDGIMNGEAVKRHEESGAPDQTFELC